MSVNTNLAPSKTPSPTFRDLFRVGRPRTPSKAPESPKVAKAPAAPSPVVRPPLPVRMATSPAPLSSAPSLREKERRGRVLVIRERLDDLVTAANAAELDMRAREDDRRRREPPHASPNPAIAAVDLIDPTETVDLPAYLFPVQSSLSPFGGLGVDNSVGAAVLADALPPRAEDAEDEAWRKALLHKAVGLSMLSIPEPTPPPSQRTASISANSALAGPASRSAPGSGSRSGSSSKPGSALPSPALPSPALPSPANIGRAIVPGSRLSTLPRTTTSLRSPGFATRELPTSAGSGGSPASKASPSLPPPPRPRTASKPSLSPASAGAEGVKPSMLPVPKHTVRRALSTPMLAQKVGTAAANANKDIAPPLPSPLSARARPRQSEGLPGGSRVPTPSKKKPRATSPSLPRPRTPLSRAPTPPKSRAPSPSLQRAVTPSLQRSMTPSLQRPATPSHQRPVTPSRAPTPSPALLLETPEGQTVLPTRDTLASLTSGSNYSDDDEIVAVDDDDDEIVAVDVEEEPAEEQRTHNRESEEDEEISEGEGLYEDDMRAPSRGGIMLRPDSRMTDATIIRPSFTEGRAFSRASNAMSAFGGLRDSDALDRARSMSPPTIPPSQRSSIAQPQRSSTLVTDVIPSTPSEASFTSVVQAQNRSPPLNVRRSQIIAPLTLQAPPSIASTVAALRSAPPPASTDFFDAVYTHSLAHGGLGFDSDSEEAEPPVPIFVQPRSRAVSTSASTSRPRPLLVGRPTTASASGASTVMHFSSTTNPYLATDPNPYQSLDPRKPVTNTPPATQTRFRGLGQMLRPATSMGLRSTGRKSPHLIQHPAVRAAASKSNAGSFHEHDGSSHGHGASSHGHGPSSHGHESVRSGAASIRSERSLGGRAAKSEESVTSARRQDPSLTRLDGMYAKHVQAEKDRLKQISAASRRT